MQGKHLGRARKRGESDSLRPIRVRDLAGFVSKGERLTRRYSTRFPSTTAPLPPSSTPSPTRHDTTRPDPRHRDTATPRHRNTADYLTASLGPDLDGRNRPPNDAGAGPRISASRPTSTLTFDRLPRLCDFSESQAAPRYEPRPRTTAADLKRHPPDVISNTSIAVFFSGPVAASRLPNRRSRIFARFVDSLCEVEDLLGG
jgi:hypothetical protein